MSARGRLGLAVAALLVLLGLAGCGGSTPTSTSTTTTASSPVPRDFFGMNVQLVEQVAENGKIAYADHSAAEIDALGVGFVRSAFDWVHVEPNPPSGGRHTYDFSGIDRWVAALAGHHLRWLVTVKGGPIPTWAEDPSAAHECGDNSPPARPSDYASLIGAVAKRYGRGGSFWSDHPELPPEPITDYEVWNEPNFATLWCPRPDPAAYARLYLAAHAAVHAVDPQARVLVGGLAAFRTDEAGPPAKMSPPTFLGRAVRSSDAFARDVDAVAVHPYGANPGAVIAALKWFRRTLDTVGLRGTPMNADEVGWHTQGELGLPAVPEELRAKYFSIITPAITNSGCGLIGMAAHTWVTPEQSPHNPEDWYGMADPITGKPHPSAIAYGNQVKALQAGDPVVATPAVCDQ